MSQVDIGPETWVKYWLYIGVIFMVILMVHIYIRVILMGYIYGLIYIYGLY